VFNGGNNINIKNKSDAFIYKTFSMRNKFTDPVVLRRNMMKDGDPQIAQVDVITQQKINKQVEKRFAKTTSTQNYNFKRNNDPLALTRRAFKKFLTIITNFIVLMKLHLQYTLFLIKEKMNCNIFLIYSSV